MQYLLADGRDQHKRMSAHVKTLLEYILELQTRNIKWQQLEPDGVPKTTTIQNWVSEFSRRWKEAMALRFLGEAEGSDTSNLIPAL